MGLEDFIPAESPESWWNSAEISEKYKEAAKKAGAWIKRTKKDEKKAKKYDFLLANFLVEMILKKKYDVLLEKLFDCLDAWHGTNFLLGILSLVYLPVSNEIRSRSHKPEINFHYEIRSEAQEFDDIHLPEPIRERVNAWIEDIEDVIFLESSTIIMKRTMNLMVYDDHVREFVARVFVFFFQELHITVSHEKALSYSEFILGELQKSLRRKYPNILARDAWEAEEI